MNSKIDKLFEYNDSNNYNNNKKIIINVKNKNEKYVLFNAIGIIILFTAPVLIVWGIHSLVYNMFGTFSIGELLSILLILPVAILIGIYFLQYTKIYFTENKLIIKKLFKKEFDINLDENPRVYIETVISRSQKARSITRFYFFCFQQKEKETRILISHSNVNELKKLINNLEIISIEDASEEIRLKSANEKEGIIHKYEKEHPFKQIVDIKDTQKIIKFKNPNFIMKFFAWIALFMVIIYSCFMIKSVNSFTLSHLFIYGIMILIVGVGVIYQYISNIIQISFKNNELISINGINFNYRENIVKIKFSKEIFMHKIKYAENGEAIGNYIMEISDNCGNNMRKKIDKKNIKKMEELIENLELKEI